MAAVEADPAAGRVGDEELVLGQQLVEGPETAGVALFDLRDQLKLPGNLPEALLPGLCGKGGIGLQMLLLLVLRGGSQQGQDVGMKIPEADSVYLPRPSTARLKMTPHITEVQRPQRTRKRQLSGTWNMAKPSAAL